MGGGPQPSRDLRDLAALLREDTGTPPDLDIERLAEIGRLSVREAELLAEIAAIRELSYETRSARDFADTEAAGYIDRTFLNRGTQ